ncbi:MAG: hypothetical protein LBT33_10790 [Spirochaetia bacterium]|jgi:hypothetical protein|nr:hypothetical protein [Spirochaetia bacterium]
MAESANHNPAVIIPYPGVSVNPGEQDIFVYLRPESNGVLVESIMLKVVQRNPDYRKRLFLAYLANLPGEFIRRNRITADHYPVRLRFAEEGAGLFTRHMKAAFSGESGVAFSRARILGGFAALQELGISSTELFDVWVESKDIIMLNGQTIKKIGDCYVVNPDIPELMRMNCEGTNIAVMIFRTAMNYAEFTQIVQLMEKALMDARILLPERPSARIFHYSKGPFEQILDGLGYLFTPEAVHIPLSDLPFSRFLAARGMDFPLTLGYIRHPIIQYAAADGSLREKSIYDYTKENSYEETWQKLLTVKAQALLMTEKAD